MREGMRYIAGDQADGLRRLFGVPDPQVLAFVAGGESCGRTTLLAQTSLALAHAGQGVVAIDENPGPDNLFDALGLAPRGDLLDVVQNGRAPQQAMLPAAPLLTMVAASRLTECLQYVDVEAADRLDDGLREIHRGSSFVLIDSAIGRGGHLSPLTLAAGHIVVVLTAQGSSITQTYSFIKRLARECGRDEFQVVITRARNEHEAVAIFENIRHTAHRHLGVRLEYLGASRVPVTDDLSGVLMRRWSSMLSEHRPGGFLQFRSHSLQGEAYTRQTEEFLETVV